MLAEQLEIVHGHWAAGAVLFAGRHYRLERARRAAQAGAAPHPPLLMGGRRARAARRSRRAGRTSTTRRSPRRRARERCKARVDAACEAAGREPIPFSVMTGVLVGRDRAELERRAELPARGARIPALRSRLDHRHASTRWRSSCRVPRRRRRARDVPAPAPRRPRHGRADRRRARAADVRARGARRPRARRPAPRQHARGVPAAPRRAPARAPLGGRQPWLRADRARGGPAQPRVRRAPQGRRRRHVARRPSPDRRARHHRGLAHDRAALLPRQEDPPRARHRRRSRHRAPGRAGGAAAREGPRDVAGRLQRAARPGGLPGQRGEGQLRQPRGRDADQPQLPQARQGPRRRPAARTRRAGTSCPRTSS